MFLFCGFSKNGFKQFRFGIIGQHGFAVNGGHEIDELGVDVEPGLAAFAGPRVDLLLDLVSHLLDLQPLLAEKHRIRDSLRFPFDEFSQKLVVKIVVVENLGVVFFVLFVTAGRLLAQYVISRPGI